MPAPAELAQSVATDALQCLAALEPGPPICTGDYEGLGVAGLAGSSGAGAAAPGASATNECTAGGAGASGSSGPPQPISAEKGQDVADKAGEVAGDYEDRGVSYQYGGDAADDGTTSDCSHYVHDVMQQSGVDVPYVTTSSIANSTAYESVPAGQQRPGDVIVQGGHMGVYNGTTDSQGRPQGWEMGNSGAQLGSWGPNGWFNQSQPANYYRPRQ